MAYVSLRHLAKRYGAVQAIDDVSLDVARGELIVLLGPSGSGKSSVLKAIAGIETLDAGEIWLDGARVDGIVPQLRDVAMVFQSYALYPHMSVFHNLAFPLKSAGLGRGEVREAVAEVAALLGLEALLGRRPRQLSGGQQQRVALGRAIVRRPKLFLMDEPLSSLDAKMRSYTRLELSRLHEGLGATTLYVTHDQVEAMTMGHRIAVVHDGRLRQVDRPEVVYEHPADLVVADFVGSPPMNCIPVRARRAGDLLVLRGSGMELRLNFPELVAGVRWDLPDGESDVVLGIRPEYLRLVGEATPGSGTVAGVVERVELLGNERVVHLRAGRSLAVRVPAAVKPRPGESARIGLAPEGIRLFDPGTGRSLGSPAATGAARKPSGGASPRTAAGAHEPPEVLTPSSRGPTEPGREDQPVGGPFE